MYYFSFAIGSWSIKGTRKTQTEDRYGIRQPFSTMIALNIHFMFLSVARFVILVHFKYQQLLSRVKTNQVIQTTKVNNIIHKHYHLGKHKTKLNKK